RTRHGGPPARSSARTTVEPTTCQPLSSRTDPCGTAASYSPRRATMSPAEGGAVGSLEAVAVGCAIGRPRGRRGGLGGALAEPACCAHRPTPNDDAAGLGHGADRDGCEVVLPGVGVRGLCPDRDVRPAELPGPTTV